MTVARQCWCCYWHPVECATLSYTQVPQSVKNPFCPPHSLAFLKSWGGEVHGLGYPAFPYKLRTGPWQLSGGTTTHQSLPLDETAPNNWVSRSRWDRICWNSVIPRMLSFKTKNFFPKSTKNHQKGAKCLAAVVLDNLDRALRWGG